MDGIRRTPTINGMVADHWARSWSVVVGKAGFTRGVVVGETSADGWEVARTVFIPRPDDKRSKSLDISLRHISTKNGRPRHCEWWPGHSGLFS